ncbi:hypothetical protein TNCT_410181 [Trichonephila clavata]|uniref:Uncharacterized protein n=1 Tax=Trichonephila clavata TaxID=2740835 RepID=A0A8X6L5M2_TRICU|nr:hypothetical protein TNCT_410181 [Trichonephila clavata]
MEVCVEFGVSAVGVLVIVHSFGERRKYSGFNGWVSTPALREECAGEVTLTSGEGRIFRRMEKRTSSSKLVAFDVVE